MEPEQLDKWDNYSTFMKDNGEVYQDAWQALYDKGEKINAYTLKTKIHELDDRKTVNLEKTTEYLTLHNNFFDLPPQPQNLGLIDAKEEGEIRKVFGDLLKEKTQEMTKPAYEPANVLEIRDDYYHFLRETAEKKTDEDLIEIIAEAEEQGISYSEQEQQTLRIYILWNRKRFYLANASNYELHAEKIYSGEGFNQFLPGPILKIMPNQVAEALDAMYEDKDQTYQFGNLVNVIKLSLIHI